jgi:WD40 repeat protein
MTLWHPAAVQHACYSPSGELIATVCSDGTARIWRAEEGAVQAQPIIPGDTVENLAFAPDSSLVALGGTGGKVCLWSLHDSRPLWSSNQHSDRVSQLIFSADGKKLATGAGVKIPSGAGDKDGNVNILETRSGRLLGRITNACGAVTSLAFAPDARRLAIGYRCNRVEIWDVEKMQRLGEPLTLNNGWVWHVCFSHDGKWLATSSGGNATQLWDALAPVNQPLKAYTHGNGVNLACFNSDDKLVLTCSGDRTARVWERESGKPITEPLPYEALGFPFMGAFSPDDRAVLAASGGGATVWDVKSGRDLCEAFRQDGGLTCAAFSPDGSHILTAGFDGAVMIHNWVDIQETPPGWLMALAEAVGGYRLNDGGVAEFLDGAAQDIDRLRQTLGAADSSLPLVRWGQWYLADRSTRPISANSKISVRDYARRLASQPGLRGLEEALDLDPTNPIIYARLAKLTEQGRPETASLYRRIARELGGSDLDAPAVEPKAASTAATNDPSAAGRELLDPIEGQALLQKVGQAVAVKGEVVKFGTSRSGTFHYLNFSEDFTGTLSLAFKIADNPAEFKQELLQGYLKKVVVVQGVISEHLGRPQILMKSLGQITLWDEWQRSEGAKEAPK